MTDQPATPDAGAPPTAPRAGAFRPFARPAPRPLAGAPVVSRAPGVFVPSGAAHDGGAPRDSEARDGPAAAVDGPDEPTAGAAAVEYPVDEFGFPGDPPGYDILRGDVGADLPPDAEQPEPDASPPPGAPESQGEAPPAAPRQSGIEQELATALGWPDEAAEAGGAATDHESPALVVGAIDTAPEPPSAAEQVGALLDDVAARVRRGEIVLAPSLPVGNPAAVLAAVLAALLSPPRT